MSKQNEFAAGDAVQFKDGKIVRRAFVEAVQPADESHPVDGYILRFMAAETGQIRSAFWAADGVAAAGPETPAFKVGDAVSVRGPEDEVIVEGKVFEVRKSDAGSLVPHYAVMFKGTNGETDLAWWGERSLAAAA